MKRVYNWIRGTAAGFRDVVMLGVSALSPAGNLRLCFKNYFLQMRTLNPQAGAISANFVASLFVGIVLLVVIIQFLWQTGIPEVLSATNNTTALTAAGATTSQINWATFIGSVVVILLLVAALIISLRATGVMGGGGGGRGRSRKRR